MISSFYLKKYQGLWSEIIIFKNSKESVLLITSNRNYNPKKIHK